MISSRRQPTAVATLVICGTLLVWSHPGIARADPVVSADPRVARVIEAAVAQIGVTLHYDPVYTRMAYPNGDVPPVRGVCSDVVIRAWRAVGLDLQQLVHDDMTRNFGVYPRRWGLKRPDANIDHRRVYNLMTWLRRQHLETPVSADANAYCPGDLVTWSLPGNLAHIGIVTDRRTPDRLRPLIVHNIGAGAQLEDILFGFTVTGHFRGFPADRR